MACFLCTHQDDRGWSALHYAALRGDTAAARVLLDAQASCENTTRHEGWTPLALAVAGGHTAVVQQLLDAGSQVRLRPHDNLNTCT